MQIELCGGHQLIIDDEDWEGKRLSSYGWYYRKNKGNGKGYVVAHAKGVKGHKRVRIHRLIMGAPKWMQVDHINGNPLDNRKKNLRLCTGAQNQANTAARGGSSKFKGVSWIKQRNKWVCAFRANNEYVYVGYFRDELEAAEAYNREAFKRLGEFARLNDTGGGSSVVRAGHS